MPGANSLYLHPGLNQGVLAGTPHPTGPKEDRPHHIWRTVPVVGLGSMGHPTPFNAYYSLTAVLDARLWAGLTANPTKCCVGLEEADYLGHTMGCGCVKPQINKVKSIKSWPQPSTKKQVSFSVWSAIITSLSLPLPPQQHPSTSSRERTNPIRSSWPHELILTVFLSALPGKTSGALSNIFAELLSKLALK